LFLLFSFQILQPDEIFSGVVVSPEAGSVVFDGFEKDQVINTPFNDIWGFY
jgi:hypothetical protein